MDSTDGVCCFCADGVNVRPFQLHHIIPHSATQDNSEENLLLVCPTHHVTIHKSLLSFEAQKVRRASWLSVVKLAQQFKGKGIAYPFGLFEPLTYDAPPEPAQLVQLGPVSPSTALLCLSPEMSVAAIASLDRTPFLAVFGGSGFREIDICTRTRRITSASRLQYLSSSVRKERRTDTEANFLSPFCSCRADIPYFG